MKERDRELDDELAAWVRLRADELIAEGHDPEAARRRAAIELGGAEQVKESVRDVRRGSLVEQTLRDVRYALRGMARAPGFTAAAILALSLGIGASVAIFSVVRAVLLRPLPYREPGRLAVILHRRFNPTAPANFLDWRRTSRAFADMGAVESWTPNLSGAGDSESVPALRVTAGLLPMVGTPPHLGRLFLPGEDQPGRDRVAILGDGLWRRRFGADPGVVGRTIALNGEKYEIVGVMPRGFDFPVFWARGRELWVPLAFGERVSSRTGFSLRVFGRLASGATMAGARAEIASITGELEKRFPGTNRDVTVTPLTEAVVGDVRPALLVLTGAVGLLLLIGCANVAHMLLARAAARTREVALRNALGATRSRLIRQLLTESVVLSAASGAVGVTLAAAAVRGLTALAPAFLPRVESVSLDPAVLAFGVALALVTGAAFGLVPALQTSRGDVAAALREGERGSSAGSRVCRLRSILVSSEFALAIVLLVGAGLLARSFLGLHRIDPGFDPEGALTATVSVAGTADADPGRRGAFYERLLDSSRAVPGVTAAGMINHLPLAGDIWGFPYDVEGRPPAPPGDASFATYRVVMPGYFAAMRIPLRAGRDFTPADRLGAPGAAIVNESFARREWPGQSAVGKRVTFDEEDGRPLWRTVVGVAPDVVRGSWTAKPEPEAYMPYLQERSYLERPGSPFQYMTLVVRGSGDPASLAAPLRRAVAALDPSATVSDVQSLRRVVGEATADTRFYLVLFGIFAASAAALAGIGIFGVVSYAVSRRTREFGIRMALGAGRGELVAMVLAESMRVALAGSAAGIAGALALTGLMRGLLYGVEARDPVTIVGVALLLAAIALVASWLPARRASRIDPRTALQAE
ncbi:MAG TPA: ABC transporter permease [Thermoanaerobaculia bacterium]|nr:ABC transporter permease [Thermoanaerobaculia bacterium]